MCVCVCVSICLPRKWRLIESWFPKWRCDSKNWALPWIQWPHPHLIKQRAHLHNASYFAMLEPIHTYPHTHPHTQGGRIGRFSCAFLFRPLWRFLRLNESHGRHVSSIGKFVCLPGPFHSPKNQILPFLYIFFCCCWFSSLATRKHRQRHISFISIYMQSNKEMIPRIIKMMLILGEEKRREREREKERSTREAITVPSFLPTRVGSDWAICKRGGFIG